MFHLCMAASGTFIFTPTPPLPHLPPPVTTATPLHPPSYLLLFLVRPSGASVEVLSRDRDGQENEACVIQGLLLLLLLFSSEAVT